MQIANNAVVGIDYTLTDDQGTVLDTSDGRQPLYFIQGVGQIISGLEEALEGKAAGETFDVRIPPEKAYGERNDNMVQQVPRDRFPADQEVAEGMQFHANTPQGPVTVVVTKVGLEEVTVDANHPLAGQSLNFNVNIVEVREATAEELDHGHVHGPGGVHH
jgi:FKBP-type peptidyl-prolyl cis-trans isomerase SlyD